MSVIQPSILVVEDDEDDFFLLKRAFDEAGGCLLQWVRSGDEALAWFQQQSAVPALIISDLKMPKTDGFELLEYAKGHATLRRIPFIILTASNEPNDRERARKHGADLYLVKPSRYGELLDVAARLVAWARKVGDGNVRSQRQILSELKALVEMSKSRFLRPVLSGVN